MASFHTTRNKSGRGPLGCLIPLIAATVLLAAGVTLISWFVIEDKDLEPPPPTSISNPGTPGERVGSTPSIGAIIEVIESDGFVEYGVPESIDLGSQRQISYKFRQKEGEGQDEIHLTIYTFSNTEKVYDKLAEVSAQGTALRMGHRVIELDAPRPQTEAKLPGLADKLETYQKILNDK